MAVNKSERSATNSKRRVAFADDVCTHYVYPSHVYDRSYSEAPVPARKQNRSSYNLAYMDFSK